MANLIESPVYVAGIFQLEKTTPPLGGVPVIDNGIPSAGHANAQAQQLANRTAYLKQQLDDGGSATNLATNLADKSDPTKGATLIGWDGDTVGEQMDLSKKLANYTALGNYTGSATRIKITQSGIAGTILRDPTVTVGNGGTTFLDGLGRGWRRDFIGPVLLDWFRPIKASDITDALKALAAYVNAQSEIPYTPVVEIPPGSYTVTEQIVFTTAVGLRAAGAFNTVLTWGANAVSAGLVFNHTQVRGRPSVQGITLERTGAYGGTGIKLYRETPALDVQQKVRIDDVSMRNNNGGWETGIEGERTTGAWVSRYEFIGNADPRDPAKYYGTALRIKGLSLTPSVHWTIHDFTCAVAYKAVEALNVEGVFIEDYNFVSVDYGVIFQGGSAGTDPVNGRPHLHLGAGHISHRRDGVVLQNAQQSFVTNALFYFMSTSVATDAHVRLINSRCCNIDDNILTFGTGLGKGIALEGSSENAIGINTWQLKGTSAISFDATSNSNTADLQNYTAAWTKAERWVNSGSGNVTPGASSRFALPTTTLTTGTNTKLTIGGGTNELGDLRPSGDLTRMVIAKSGRYSIAFKAAFSASANGDRSVSVWLNGAQPGYMPENISRATAAGLAIITAERSGIYLSAGDYLEVYASQSSGGDLSIIASNVQVTYLGS